jgi:hypothetical protein
MSTKKSPLERLDRVRNRLNALSNKGGDTYLREGSKEVKPTASSAPPEKEKETPQVIAPPKPSKGYTANDRAFRQMNIYFDQAEYAAQCAAGKPKNNIKLSKKQIETLKRQKQEKKREKLKEWLYND